jgi:hypothetical protein
MQRAVPAQQLHLTNTLIWKRHKASVRIEMKASRSMQQRSSLLFTCILTCCVASPLPILLSSGKDTEAAIES